MRRRGFHHSRLFWCGVPGLVFLLWVWWDSGGYDSELVWRRGIVRELNVRFGVVDWRSVGDGSSGPGVGSISTERSRILPSVVGPLGRKLGRQFDFPPLFTKSTQEIKMVPRNFHIVRVSVALWAIVLGYVVVWLGAVVAWELRKVRVSRRLTEVGMEKEVAV